MEVESAPSGDAPAGQLGDQEPRAGPISTPSKGSSDEWEISQSQTMKTYEAEKLNFWQAVGINTLNMFGTGPFITVPFLFAATVPAGPQALIGYALAAVFCICDSTVWGELSSMSRSFGSLNRIFALGRLPGQPRGFVSYI
eukprot:scaffold174296_cov47-Prasinocladus_malaysianus.AAC.2